MAWLGRGLGGEHSVPLHPRVLWERELDTYFKVQVSELGSETSFLSKLSQDLSNHENLWTVELEGTLDII